MWIDRVQPKPIADMFVNGMQGRPRSVGPARLAVFRITNIAVSVSLRGAHIITLPRADTRVEVFWIMVWDLLLQIPDTYILNYRNGNSVPFMPSRLPRSHDRRSYALQWIIAPGEIFENRTIEIESPGLVAGRCYTNSRN